MYFWILIFVSVDATYRLPILISALNEETTMCSIGWKKKKIQIAKVLNCF